MIKRLGRHDLKNFQQLILLFREVFEMVDVQEASETYLMKLLERPDIFVFVIMSDNEVAGGLTAYELPLYYSESSEVYIYDIAVKQGFRGHGLGRKLIEALKEHCQQNSISTFFVEALEEDRHAVEFYRSTGGIPEKVIHFNYLLNKPG